MPKEPFKKKSSVSIYIYNRRLSNAKGIIIKKKNNSESTKPIAGDIRGSYLFKGY